MGDPQFCSGFNTMSWSNDLDGLGVRKPPSSDPLRGSELFLDILMDQAQAEVNVEI